MPDESDVRLALTPTQQALFEAIAEKREGVAASYHAAAVILNDPVLPDRLALAVAAAAR